MRRAKVVSSQILSIGYDAQTETLEIEFKGGSVYQYEEVPAEVHAAFMTAPSKGNFFRERIKGRDRNNPPFKFKRMPKAVAEA